MTFWAVIGGLTAFGLCFWIMGKTSSTRKLTIAEIGAARQKEIADAKSREAAIYAKPAGSKSDIIDRL